MKLTDGSLRNPAAVVVVVALVIALGIFAVTKLPIQLFPDIEEPQITVFTAWRAAAPAEVESELIEPQEAALQGMPGLKQLNAFANAGGSWMNLRFNVGTDMQKTLVDVISRMNQLPPLPRDASPPVISLGEDGGGGANQTLSWFFIQLLPGTPGPVENYQKFIEDVVKPRIEAVPGVAVVNVNAGAPEELQIRFDPYRAAQLGIEIPAVAAVAGSANDTSGGYVEVGRRQYALRFAGRYSPEQLGEQILAWRDGSAVRLRDIATIEVRRGDRQNLAMQNGNPAMGIQIIKESGANVLETLGAVKAEIGALREGQLKEMGLAVQQSFDPSLFINQAIGLVSSNLFAGVLLALGVLWFFMRHTRAVVLVGLTIPICLLATFITLELTGRTLNVISLAGLAFGVGMVLDAAIIVMENVLRLQERGELPQQAASVGTKQVWPALVASTVTTVAIFVPVLFMKDAEGQLFADLALTISIANVISMFVAVTVVPVAVARWVKAPPLKAEKQAETAAIAHRLVRLSDGKVRRRILIGVLIGVPILLTVALKPRLEYLPPVKRAAIDAFFQFPPGASVETIDREIVQTIAKRMKPYMDGVKEPALLNYYVLVWPGGGGTLGARVKDQSRLPDLQKILETEVLVGFPDFRAFASEGNLFGGFGDGRNIDLMLQSADMQSLYPVARTAMQLIEEKMPGAQVQPWQGLEAAEPELRITPDDRRLTEAGWNRATAGNVIRAMGDGLWIGEHFDGDKRMDVILRADGWITPEELESVPLATPSGAVMPLGDLMAIETKVGPGGLRRVDRKRTVSLGISPPRKMSLDEAIEILKRDVEPQLKSLLPEDGTIRYGGSADNLANAVTNMGQNFALAILVLFLIMAAMFRSVRDATLVVLTIPLATVGGVLALRVLNLVSFQPLDLLTMIGFVIMMGLVVNNAILLVDQTRTGERDGLPRREAVLQAIQLRIRPIFSTTAVSLVGMLPLAVVPGPGSTLYRGLGAVIVGGMMVSTLFTLILLPALLRLGEREPADIVEEPAPPRMKPQLERVA
ncbi:MAG TPA: efflux RND transporter permease subunit [Steroidobacteraceae bacterium]|nr:efflux RND transporter permease subunit [Steroidobacteraceae bacterium]